MFAAFVTINIRLLNQMARTYFAYSNNTTIRLFSEEILLELQPIIVVKTCMVVCLHE